MRVLFIAIPLLGLLGCGPLEPIAVEEEARSWVEIDSMVGVVHDVSVSGRAVLTEVERDVEGLRDTTLSANGYGERGYINVIAQFPDEIESLPQGRSRLPGSSVFVCAFDETRDRQRDAYARSVDVWVEPTETGADVTLFVELPNEDALELSFHAMFAQRDTTMGWAEPSLELVDEPY